MAYLPGPQPDLFAPDQAVPRQDVAVAVGRILGARGELAVLDSTKAASVLNAVPDASTINPALRVYVATAIQNGIMLGTSGGNFDPGGSLTRAQVAVLLARLLGMYPAAVN